MAIANQNLDADTNLQRYTQDLLSEMVRLQQRSIAESSQRQYKGTWQQWRTFCAHLGVSRWLPQRDPETQSLLLVVFAIHCWSGGNQHGRASASTIQSKLCHIRWYHRAFAGFDPQLRPNHALAIAGMRRTGPATRRRGTVTRQMLEWIIRHLDFKHPQHRVLAGAAILGFFFLLRSAEYLAVKGRRRIYTLQVRDVILQDELGLQTSSLHTAVAVEITLRGQKNDQQGHGTKRVLSRSGHRALCPVLAGRLLTENARNLQLRPEDPICSIKASTMLPAETMSKVLQAAAKATGEDATLFSCHSLRRGGATALLSAGVDSTAVMLHGRWKTDSYQRYTSYTNESGRHLAAQMAFGVSSTVQQAVPRQ
ncbi:hypothetical protein GN958_ATG16903 [Phytophthora infestans]|uniref:Tyr recombinase domain-containing protein n=1 Tax=Phytophthora infestans TaxID=4787 RepID=A0A8S9TY24_PHYIN|nr:hypothetical protein GN958_ATG16903 [Phytophthora infestans]